MDRNKKIEIWNSIFTNVNDIIPGSFSSNEEHKKFKKLYDFHVAPGGRAGGLDTRIIEIFYGAKPCDYERKIDHNFQISDNLLMERGATLAYYRKDNGNILCYLFPAASKNGGPEERQILVGEIQNIEKFNLIIKKHLMLLLSYMHVTSLEGSPTAFDKFKIAKLRFFSSLLINGTFESSKCRRLLQRVFELTITVGLSGSLIFLVQLYREPSNESQIQQLHEGLKPIEQKVSELNDLNKAAIEVSKQIKSSLDSISIMVDDKIKYDSMITEKAPNKQ